ncbi:iron-sulfur cluster repair protein YtfE [Caldimonas caldifontis]|uniref:Iron-sulfur cluster repair di-iron protein n=1 Tax=Caldimonas caldifontis TaxID=1452508 RepID=A0A2S5SS89_9BURK|nr:iron-sulfur cluster repair protein YtfE [Caldimonas caldifontis]PPE65576.1 iron-sulfur cluster repair di-iron protein [Caldimonas caldifontis]
MPTTSLIDQPLGQLARTLPGATQVFHDFQLDFCCGGKHSLREAAAGKGLDAQAIAARLEALRGIEAGDGRDWTRVPVHVLIDHILNRYHARLREQVPELIRLARRVEQVHGDRPECPRGLADHLEAMQQELESHMLKEEQVLFPMLMHGMGGMAGGPIAVMRGEHDQHGEELRRLEELTDGITLPRGACNTWRALYLGLATLREELMEHIHLENNILFEGLNPVRATEASHA